MKTIITLIFALVLSSTQAQNIMDLESVSKEAKEAYMISIFQECKILYCSFDYLDDGIFVKKIELEFLDTTFFFGAYLSSSSFTIDAYEKCAYECTYVQMDDGGNGLGLDHVALDELPYLKKILTILMQETRFIPYTGRYLDMD